MVKTSVYLDDQTKADLAVVSQLTGRPQADLIRDGVAQIVEQHLARRPRMRARSEGIEITARIDELMGGFGR